MFQAYDTSCAEIDSATLLLKSMRPPDAMRILKTWLNGWATSKRMAEVPVLHCLLGCDDGLDCLSHYLQCPMLFSLLVFLTGGCSADPLVRIGLKAPTIS